MFIETDGQECQKCETKSLYHIIKSEDILCYFCDDGPYHNGEVKRIITIDSDDYNCSNHGILNKKLCFIIKKEKTLCYKCKDSLNLKNRKDSIEVEKNIF